MMGKVSGQNSNRLRCKKLTPETRLLSEVHRIGEVAGGVGGMGNECLEGTGDWNTMPGET